MDICLVYNAVQGDAEAMASLFQQYRPRLYLHALRIFGNTPDAQDVLQDTFIDACTNISSLRNPTAFYAWLKRILYNNCYQHLRKQKTRLNFQHSFPADSLIEQSIEQQLEKYTNGHHVYQALNGLSPELRSCMLLRHFSRFTSYDEIAAILGIPVGTVRSRLSAARDKLYTMLSRQSNGCDKAFREAKQWSDYYLDLWKKFYDDHTARSAFVNQMNRNLHIRYTSGGCTIGRSALEKEFNNDLVCGSRYLVTDVYSSGNISILEGPNYNSPEHPYRCSPSTVVVLFRNSHNNIEACNIFDSSRPL